MKLLHVDSSILGPNSVSRTLTAEIVEREKSLHPGLEVIYRDLAETPQAHLSGTHMAVWHAGATPPQDAALEADLAASEAILQELLAADIIVIGAPMYNFAIPSQLKAWIDRVVVRGRTFRYGEAGPESLLAPGKKLILASTRGGGYGPGAPAAFLDHQETYLKGVLGFIGLTDVIVIRAEGIAMGAEALASAMTAARKDITALAA